MFICYLQLMSSRYNIHVTLLIRQLLMNLSYNIHESVIAYLCLYFVGKKGIHSCVTGSVWQDLKGSRSDMIFITPALPVVESKGNGFSLETPAVIDTVSSHVTLSTFGSKLLNCCYFIPGLHQKRSQQVQNSNFSSPNRCTLHASIIQQCYIVQALLMRRPQNIIRPFHKQYSIAKKKSPICCPTRTFSAV